MSIFSHVSFSIFFLILLQIGSEIFVGRAKEIGEKIGISEIAIGIFFIGFGTSLPELAVSLQSILSHHPGISVGNIIGSNICNLSLILGIALFLLSLPLSGEAKKNLQFLFFLFLIQSLTLLDNTISLGEGIFFLLLFCFYLKKNFFKEKRENFQNKPFIFKKEILSIFLILFSIFLIHFSSQKLVFHSIKIANILQIPDIVIGLVAIALGTSLPELFSVIAAAKRGSPSLILGNLIGSCFFNSLAILGILPLVGKITSLKLNSLTLIVMSILPLLLLCFLKRETHRKKKGGALIFIYFLYIIFTLIH